METLRIVGLAMLSAVGYGVLHDQVTARICVEYFTIGHPVIYPTSSPTLLGIIWGVVATWWMGLALGILLALCARLGPRPKLTVRQMRRPIALLLAVVGVCAVAAGGLGGLLARAGQVWLVEPLATMVPRERHIPFLIDLWSHSASYVASTVGGLALSVWAWRKRSEASSS